MSLRRGKTDGACAVWRGPGAAGDDALQALAFELLTPQDGSVPDAIQARLCACWPVLRAALAWRRPGH